MPFGQKPVGQKTFDQHIYDFNFIIAKVLWKWFYVFLSKIIWPTDIWLKHLWNHLYHLKATLKKGPCLLVKNQLAKRHLTNTSMTSILSLQRYSENGSMSFGPKPFGQKTFGQHIYDINFIFAKVLWKWFYVYWSKTIWPKYIWQTHLWDKHYHFQAPNKMVLCPLVNNHFANRNFDKTSFSQKAFVWQTFWPIHRVYKDTCWAMDCQQNVFWAKDIKHFW